jgi:hypothetical protein
MHSLPKHLKQIATFLVQSRVNNGVQPNDLVSNKQAITVRNKKEAPKIDLSIECDRMKYFKITKKAIYLCDKTIEKRSEKPCRLETERQFELNARELFQPYFKPITAKIYNNIDMIENLLDDDELIKNNKNLASESEKNAQENIGQDDDEHHVAGEIDDDFDIPCTAQTNEPFFTQQGTEFAQTQGVDLAVGGMAIDDNLQSENGVEEQQAFDGNNLIEAPLNVNPLNIEYSKTSKNINVRQLKHVIWSLLCSNNDKVNDSFK